MKRTIFILTLLCTLVFSVQATETTDIAGPAGSTNFGASVKVLSNGNFIVVDFVANTPAYQGGAVYLYDGSTKQLISRLYGSSGSDRVGSGGINILPSGDFIVRSPSFQGTRGAVTFCYKASGCNGAVSSTNSLVGYEAGNSLGAADPHILSTGNFVVGLTGYVIRGAVTFCSGTSPTVGVVSIENSLVGEKPTDGIGNPFITPLSSGGYAVESPGWNEGVGAVTFCDGTTGCKGFVSSANSLVGQNPGNGVGHSPVYMDNSVKEVGHGNFIVISDSFDNNGLQDVGAVTWVSPASGLTGTVTLDNSLVGTVANGKIGQVIVLENGNYVVMGGKWITFGDGATGVFGLASEANSIYGTEGNGDLNMASVTPLKNGNYVVNAPTYSFSLTFRGAARLCSGTGGCIGRMTAANSLTGVDNYGLPQPVTPLMNGNYVVKSSKATTFGNGETGIVGTITSENSLINPNSAPYGMIVPLPNGNYYVLNASWDPAAAPGGGSRGAVTLGNGKTGTVGLVSATNSLVNERPGDAYQFSSKILPSGDLLVISTSWNGYRGAVTLVSGTTPPIGVINAGNSIVGTDTYETLGETVDVLANGNYVVDDYNWNGVRGAVRFCEASRPCVGEISSANSLVGTNPGDRVGGVGSPVGVYEVGGTHFVVSSPNWNGGRGAATLVSSSAGLSGPVGPENSLIGRAALDNVSGGSRDISYPIPGVINASNGVFVIDSPKVDTPERVDAGAITVGAVYSPLAGTVDQPNTFFAGVESGPGTLSVAYDKVNRQLIIGRRVFNTVTVFKPDLATPPNITISGTLKTPDGAPLRQALVRLTSSDGSETWRMTKLSGSFAFENMAPLRDYSITVASKRFRFVPRYFTDAAADLRLSDMIGQR
jgi:Repeat of unknown function (DUF5650)